MKLLRPACLLPLSFLFLLFLQPFTLAQQSRTVATSSTPSTSLIFTPASSFGNGAKGIAVGDVNGDGRPDIVASLGSGLLQVFLGNGDGTFQPSATYSAGNLGSGGSHVVIADVNGDGKPDVIASSCDDCAQTGVVVLLNKGDGTFNPATSYVVPGEPLTGLAVVDVNNDGKPDIITSHSFSGGVAVLLNNGGGSFSPSSVVLDEQVVSLAVADMNGDGYPDLVVDAQNLGENHVSVSLGNGDGTFKPGVTYGKASYPEQLSVADLNGDGKQDVVLTALPISLGHSIGIMLGNGDGTLKPTVSYGPGGSFDSYRGKPIIGDINGDGIPDVMVTNEVGALYSLYGKGDGTFRFGPSYYGFAADGSSTLVDINGDGRPDLITVVPFVADIPAIYVFLNNAAAPPTITKLVSDINPANRGQTVTYTATVTGRPGEIVNGSIAFQEGSSSRDGFALLATVPLTDNKATYSTSYTRSYLLGPEVVTAQYAGIFLTHEGSQNSITECIRFRSTNTVVTTSGSPSKIGEPVTFTATVGPPGTISPAPVDFYDGSKLIGTVTVSNDSASFTTSSLSAKTHSISAVYTGSCDLRTSRGLVTQVVEP